MPQAADQEQRHPIQYHRQEQAAQAAQAARVALVAKLQEDQAVLQQVQAVVVTHLLHQHQSQQVAVVVVAVAVAVLQLVVVQGAAAEAAQVVLQGAVKHPIVIQVAVKEHQAITQK